MATGTRIYSLLAAQAASADPDRAEIGRIAAMGFDGIHATGAKPEWIRAARERGLRVFADLPPGESPGPSIEEGLERGFRGFRCQAASRLPAAAWRKVLSAARAREPDCIFCADVLGRPLAEWLGLEGAGFDYLFSSVGWWNGRDPWFLEQAPLLERVAPSLGLPLLVPQEGGAVRKRRLLLAASLTTGLWIPLGFERAADEDISGFVAQTNHLKAATPELSRDKPPRGIDTRADGAVLAVRAEGDDEGAAIVAANLGSDERALDLDGALPEQGEGGGELLEITPDAPSDDEILQPLRLKPGEVRILRYLPRRAWKDGDVAPRPGGAPPEHIVIEAIAPEVDGGRFPAKRIVGDDLVVSADVFRDGHDLIGCLLRVQPFGETTWTLSTLSPLGNDRWSGRQRLEKIGRARFAIEAWTDHFASWRDELKKKRGAGRGVALELIEGRGLLTAAAERAAGPTQKKLRALLARFDELREHSEDAAADFISSRAVLLTVALAPDRSDRVLSPVREVTVDRPAARFSAWYEMFPRSQGTDPGRWATFEECALRLPAIRGLGFDVVYLVPIHPIGETNRKGRDNRPRAEPGDPGSPYAIGSPEGGHTAVDPHLGSLEDFRRFHRQVREQGMELALDFAVQCSPDHPWLREHPQWFKRRPDGTVKHAENPPKKYEDIVNVDFDEPDWRALWQSLRAAVEFWIEEGVRIFRIDNPHTKPVAFWEWLIEQIQSAHPDVLFLAEAFTRPKMMRRLAKAGFSQSYTYFTWRNTKAELTEYLTELTRTGSVEYFRPNFFVNTPDILPFFLQTGGRAAFRIRLVLAGTLSGSYGIYNGFELCEADALPDREEYAHSEKYELKVWDWDRPGNIKADLAKLNRLRWSSPALQRFDNLVFHEATDGAVLFFSKSAPDARDRIFVAVTLDPFRTVRTDLIFPLAEMGLGEGDRFTTDELFSDYRQEWTGSRHAITLDPSAQPALVWRVR